MRPSCPWGLVFLLLVLALVVGPGWTPAAAASLDGEYLIPFTGAESIWPLSEFQDCESDVIDGNDVELCLSMSLTRSGKGAVLGSGTFDFLAQGIGVDIEGNLAGTLKGSIKGTDKRGYKQTVSVKYKGTVSVAGVGGDLPATMTGKLTTSITPAGLIESKGSLKVAIKRGGTTKAKIKTGLSQLEEGSGDWTLKLTIQASADQTKLSGTAELMLPDGSHFLPVKGSYKTKQDKADIDAKGKAKNKGMVVELKSVRSNEPGVFEQGTVSYEVQGFSGRKSLKTDNK